MNARLRRFSVLLIAVAIGLVLLESAAVACPTCKDSIAHSDPARANLVRGYFWSILFMMSMPFLILGGLSALFWWEIRKSRRRQNPAQVMNVTPPAREPVEV